VITAAAVVKTVVWITSRLHYRYALTHYVQ
jgi:hypothetical protein